MLESKDKGVVLQMQDYSINDGDGVRTTIFLPGCPLRCKWCSNPETWTIEKKLIYYKHKCKNCGKCKQKCPYGFDPTTMKRQNEKCSNCTICEEVCINKSLKNVCEVKDVREIVDLIKRDEIFFRHTGGGVTFSGGEPFEQHEFLRTLVNKLGKNGIDMWVETCGYFDFDKVKDIIQELSHVFLDLKHMDSKKHKELTSVKNELILKNAAKISQMGVPITVRIPSIQGINLTEENVTNTAKFMKEKMKNATIELLPYHELGKEKYISLGIEDKFNNFIKPTDEEITKAYDIFNNYGIKVEEYK